MTPLEKYTNVLKLYFTSRLYEYHLIWTLPLELGQHFCVWFECQCPERFTFSLVHLSNFCMNRKCHFNVVS